jgi:F-type H+-transporting ATPase subunit gamma
MANLKEIQRQIKSVSGTQKTTRAMKLVSTAKLRRTEELAKRSSLYAKKLNEVIQTIANRVASSKFDESGNSNPESIYFQQKENVKTVSIVFVTADKGLCGGFNSQTIKTVRNMVEEFKSEGKKVRLHGIGKKGIEFFNFNNIELLDAEVGLSSAPDYDKASKFILKVIEDFVSEKTDEVILVHNGYKNMITQELKITQLLPVDISKVAESKEVDANATLEIEAYNEETVLETLLNKYIEYNMYYTLIDSLAAEHSARMQAMDAATNNAKEMVKNLKVKFNKARQEAITTELIEIISGVESMKS